MPTLPYLGTAPALELACIGGQETRLARLLLTVDDLPIVYVPSHLLLQETTWNLEGNDDSESGCLKAWNAERCLCMTEAKLQACKHIRQGSLVGMAIVSSLLAIGPALPAYLVVSWG